MEAAAIDPFGDGAMPMPSLRFAGRSAALRRDGQPIQRAAVVRRNALVR
jgi:hypothetical protein